MSSQITNANGGSGDLGRAEQVGHAAVAGDPGAGGGLPVASPWLRCSRSRPPDSTSQYQATIRNPGGSQAWDLRTCRRKDATGSCIRLEVRPMNATGTTSAGPAVAATDSAGPVRSGPMSGSVLLCPLEQPPDRLGLPGIQRACLWPGGYCDFEPDFQSARPFPFPYIICNYGRFRNGCC